MNHETASATIAPTSTPNNTENFPPLPRIAERFLTKLEEDSNGCWNYTGACLKDKNGDAKYGIFWNGKTSQLAHRYAFLTFISDEIGDTDVIHHKCNNPKCCNFLSHLAVASHKQNSAAARQDGLLNVPRKPYRKATQTEIDEIRKKHAQGTSKYALAIAYGRSQPYIAAVVSGKLHPIDRPIKPKRIIQRRPTPASAAVAMQEVAA